MFICLVFSGCSGKDEVMTFGIDSLAGEEFETGTDNDEAAPDRPEQEGGGTGEADTAGDENVEADEEILVYVCGAVNEPGVYRVPKEGRVTDALELAGGFCEGANRVYVNLAASLRDGEQIYFPFEDEDASEIGGKTESGEKPSGDAFGDEGGPININTADKDALCRIPGIGDSKAAGIIAYREDNGRFYTIEDIKNVTGIGDALFNRIKDYICAE